MVTNSSSVNMLKSPLNIKKKIGRFCKRSLIVKLGKKLFTIYQQPQTAVTICRMMNSREYCW